MLVIFIYENMNLRVEPYVSEELESQLKNWNSAFCYSKVNRYDINILIKWVWFGTMGNIVWLTKQKKYENAFNMGSWIWAVRINLYRLIFFICQ